MNPSALTSQISNKLRSISAHDLQLLAEEMAIVKYPARFRGVQILRTGRSEEGQTSKGWPDAFVVTDSDHIDAIEATREKQSWERHLEDDFHNAKSRKERKLSGYFFVGGYPDHSPSSTDTEKWVKNFSQLGIQPENIGIFVGKELALELSAPEYARIRQEILGIPSSPSRFQHLVPGALTDSRVGIFQPSLDDFKRGTVWRPTIMATAISELERNGCALVRGHGASGKTTLAQLIPLESAIRPSPVYYVDLNSMSSSAADIVAAKNDIVLLSGAGVVFVVDNIHLYEQTATDLHQHWHSFSRPHGTRLLLLGREITSRLGTPVGSLKPIVLRAGKDEIMGIVRRMFARKGLATPLIPDEELRAWQRTFGGDPSSPEVTVDLIAFSAAVETRFDALARGDFRLESSDATDVIRTRYTSALSRSEEIANLTCLAALEELEIRVPSSALPFPSVTFDVSRSELGLVLKDRVGISGRIVYRLAHPALGPLLLNALDKKDAASPERIAAACRDLALGVAIYGRSQDLDEQRRLATTISQALRGEDWLKATAELASLLIILQAAVRRKLIDKAKADAKLAQSAELRRLFLRERSIASMTNFIVWAIDKKLTHTIAAISAMSAESSVVRSILAAVCASSVVDAAAFLRIHPNGSALVRDIPAEKWSELQEQMQPCLVTRTMWALRYLERNSRTDLMIAPAFVVLRKSSEGHWDDPSGYTTIAHLSRLLKICREASEAEKRNFLETVIGKEWLIRRYESASSGVLAGALMSLANYSSASMRHYLVLPELAARVRSELQTNVKRDGELGTRAMCLLGSYVALSAAAPDLSGVGWPQDEALSTMIASLAPKSEAGILGMYELELWIGFKAMAKAREDQAAVSPARGYRFLSLLEQSSPPSDRSSEIRAETLTWLRACADSGWRLVRTD